jgi:uncharacterized membrane protein
MMDKNEKRESIKYSSIADNNTRQQSNQKPISSRDNNDPIRVLKIRFAKGQITKEQYEEMRKALPQRLTFSSPFPFLE